MDLETTSRGDKCPGVCLSTAWLIYGILQSPPLHVSTLLLGVVGEGLFWKYNGKVVLSSVFVGVSLRKDRLPMRPFHDDHSASYLSFLLYPPKSNCRPLSFNFDIVLKKLFCFSLLVFKGWMAKWTVLHCEHSVFRASCKCFPVSSWIYEQDQIIVV